MTWIGFLLLNAMWLLLGCKCAQDTPDAFRKSFWRGMLELGQAVIFLGAFIAVNVGMIWLSETRIR